MHILQALCLGFQCVLLSLMYLIFFSTFLAIHGGLQFTVVGINLFNFTQLVPVCCYKLHLPRPQTLPSSFALFSFFFFCLSAHNEA